MIFYLQKVIDHHLNKNTVDKDIIISIINLGVMLQRTGNIFQSFQYLERGIEYAKKLNLGEQEVNLDLQIGTGYYYLNEQQKALTHFYNATTLAKKIGVVVDIPTPYVLMGSANLFSSKLKQAKEDFNLAISYINEDTPTSQLLVANGLKSWTNSYLGFIKEAIEDNEQLEKLIPKIEDPNILAQAYHTSSIFHLVSGIDYNKALEFSIKAHEYAIKVDSKLYEYSCANSRANSYLNLSQYDKALKWFHRGLKISEENDIFIGIENFHSGISLTYLYDEKFTIAEEYADKYMKMAEKCMNDLPLIIILHVKSTCLYLRGELKQALKHVDKTYKIYKNTGFILPNILNLYLRSHILKKLEKTEQGIEAYNELLELVKRQPGLLFHLHNARNYFTRIDNKFKSPNVSGQSFPSSVSTVKAKIQLDNVIRTSQIISSILNIDELLKSILEEAMQVTGAERGVLIRYNTKTGEIENKIIKNQEQDSKNDFIISNTVIDKVVKNKKGIIFTKSNNQSGLLHTDSIIASDIRSIICSPLLFEDELKGVLYLDSKLINALFTEDDMKILNVFTSQAAISIENAEKNTIIHKQFSESIQIIYTLMAKSATRVYEYTQQSTKICEKLAYKMGLNSAQAERIKIASILKDVGMIGLIEKLLFSKKSLTEAEQEIIKQHPKKSVEIIQNLEGIDDIKQMILQHQEKYNGSGYPNGLKGEEISKGARIINAVDDFVLLTRKREYQTPDKKNLIKDILIKSKGVLYDPDVIDNLIELIEEESLIYIVDENDIQVNENNGIKQWIIPTNVNFETIAAGKVMDEINLKIPSIETELAFSIHYSL